MPAITQQTFATSTTFYSDVRVSAGLPFSPFLSYMYFFIFQAFSKNHARTGEVSRGRFGLAVTSLGDINYDGFGGRCF